jgi:hypothetical protein
MKIIENAWIDYLDQVITQKTSKEQVTEIQKAFYAGSLACLKGLEDLFVIATRMNDKESLSLLTVMIKESLGVELNDWFAKQLNENSNHLPN